MIAARIHPEHLIDRAKQGLATSAQWNELELHLAHCPECSAEWALAEALSETGGRACKDESALVAGVLGALEAEGRLAGTEKHRPNATLSARAHWLPWVAALTLFFAGSAAAATLILVLRPSAPRAVPAVGIAHAPPTRKDLVAPVAPEPASDAPAPGVLEPAVMEPTAALRERTHRHLRRTRRTKSADKAVSEALLSAPAPSDAATLFARARAASLRGEHREAGQTYRELEARFPQSREALVAPVMLGRIYADHLHDPAGALAQFDRYLRHPGVNRPEALMGRARCLRVLGRSAEERAALRALLEGYPDSVYVDAARRRLEALE